MQFDEEYLKHTRHALASLGKIELDLETKFTQLYFSKSVLDPVLAEFIFDHLKDADLYEAVYFFYMKLDTLKIGDVYDGPSIYGLHDVQLEIVTDSNNRITKFKIDK